VTVSDLALRRAQIEVHIAAERMERAQAVLDKRPFDMTRLRALEDELAGYDDAESEQHRRDVAASAKAAAERRATARKRIARLESTRLAAVKAAESAARGMTEALARVADISGEMTLAAQSIGMPIGALARNEIETRLSRYLATLLAPAPRWQYGVIEWNSLPQGTVPSWVEAERAAALPAIDALTKEQAA
jgi:hypothetical protein